MVFKFQEQCQRVGFFRIHYDSYPEQLAASVHSLCRKFFSLPLDQKIKASKSGGVSPLSSPSPSSLEQQNAFKCTGYRYEAQ